MYWTPKFKLGQKVFYMHQNWIAEWEICEINVKVYWYDIWDTWPELQERVDLIYKLLWDGGLRYDYKARKTGQDRPENKLFATKQDLLNNL